MFLNRLLQVKTCSFFRNARLLCFGEQVVGGRAGLYAHCLGFFNALEIRRLAPLRKSSRTLYNGGTAA